MLSIGEDYTRYEENCMKRVISISNRKGGSGKTTTAVNISAALAHQGKRVLVIDTDPQAHTTLCFGVAVKNLKGDLYSLLVNQKKPQELIVNTYLKSLKLIPASRRLTMYERNFIQHKEARLRLAEGLALLNGEYDYIIIDTPPTMSLMTVSALIASDKVIIPTQTHFLALEGVAEMVTLIGKIQKLYNPLLSLMGIIPTFYKHKTHLSSSILKDIKDSLGEQIILHPVRVNISLAEAPGFGKTIFQYNPRSNGAFDYLAIAQQIEGLV